MVSQPGQGTARFELGRLVITRNAQAQLPNDDVLLALGRHVRGDWGELGDEDKEENELSVRKGFRILSSYKAQNGVKFWVITEADRSSTTVLLPEDY